MATATSSGHVDSETRASWEHDKDIPSSRPGTSGSQLLLKDTQEDDDNLLARTTAPPRSRNDEPLPKRTYQMSTVSSNNNAIPFAFAAASTNQYSFTGSNRHAQPTTEMASRSTMMERNFHGYAPLRKVRSTRRSRLRKNDSWKSSRSDTAHANFVQPHQQAGSSPNEPPNADKDLVLNFADPPSASRTKTSIPAGMSLQPPVHDAVTESAVNAGEASHADHVEISQYEAVEASCVEPMQSSHVEPPLQIPESTSALHMTEEPFSKSLPQAQRNISPSTDIIQKQPEPFQEPKTSEDSTMTSASSPAAGTPSTQEENKSDLDQVLQSIESDQSSDIEPPTSDEAVVPQVSYDSDDLETSIPFNLSEDFLNRMRLWEETVKAKAVEAVEHWISKAEAANEKAEELDKKLRVACERDTMTKQHLTQCQAAVEDLLNQREQLNHSLTSRHTAMDTIEASLKGCRDQLAELASGSQGVQQDIATFGDEVKQILESIGQDESRHREVQDQMRVRLQQLARANSVLETQIQKHDFSVQEINKALFDNKPDWEHVDTILHDFKNSITTEFREACQITANDSGRAIKEHLPRLVEVLQRLHHTGAANEASLAGHASEFEIIKQCLDLLIDRSSIDDSSPVLDTDKLVLQLGHVLSGINATVEGRLTSILDLLAKLSSKSASLDTLNESLATRNAQVQTFQDRVHDLERQLGVLSGQLEITTIKKQHLQKENVRLAGDVADYRAEAASNRAGLADWKATASWQKQQTNEARLEAEKLKDECKLLQEKLEALRQERSAPADVGEVEIIRRRAHDEVAHLLVNKDIEDQNLRDEQFRQYSNECDKLRKTLEALDEKHKALEIRYAKVDGDHKVLLSQHENTDSLYTKLAANYKDLDKQHDELQEECNKLQSETIGARKQAGLAKGQSTYAKSQLAIEQTKHAETTKRVEELSRLNAALRSEQEQASNLDLQQEVQRLQLELTKGEADKSRRHNESKEEVAHLMQKIIELQTQVDAAKTFNLNSQQPIETSGNPKRSSNRDGIVISSPLSSVADEDESLDEEDLEDIKVTRSNAIRPATSKVPSTPITTGRPISATANSGLKRSSGISDSERIHPSQATTADDEQIEDDDDSPPRGPYDSYPRLTKSSMSLQQNAKYNMSASSQFGLIHPRYTPNPDSSPRKRSVGEAGIEDRPGKLRRPSKMPKPTPSINKELSRSPNGPSRNTRNRSGGGIIHSWGTHSLDPFPTQDQQAVKR
ncbi:Survival motor neuron-like protein 1 [Elsinoe australis]|uniref:Survival motor neuron-like protein 1 n=1 Tax=Elsinoe australis TaxID=40998 RepID=A0A2P7Z0T3_9PEZI|nr:Survival motor neuron-like protein 1 [Elsinoe australis]